MEMYNDVVIQNIVCIIIYELEKKKSVVYL